MTSGPGDPVQLAHQPFCETLRVFGRFGDNDQVLFYRVLLAAAKQDAAGNWVADGPPEDVVDPLNNQKWNEAERVWKWQVLGPDPATHAYRNVDREPEADWFEHELKVTWNSANKTDGYYLLKIVPCDEQGTPTGLGYELPVLRTDNTLPQAELTVQNPLPDAKCGSLTLRADRELTFAVTAYSPAGHILEYQLLGNRGLTARAAGDAVTGARPAGAKWNGVYQAPTVFTVNADASGCSAVAYNFELMVQGAATNGYSSWLYSRRVWKQTNLVVY